MGIKVKSTYDTDLTIPLRRGSITLPAGVVIDIDPQVAKELENIAPIVRVRSNDPEYTLDAPRVAVQEG